MTPYGDALALVTVTRTATPPERMVASLPAATARPVRVLHVDTGGAPAVAGTDLLRLPEDVGRAAAVNRGIAGLAAEVGLVAVADPGLTWAPGALDALLAAAADRPRAGVLGPVAGALPTVGDVLRRRSPAGPTGWVDGRCLLVRRVAWDSVGGYDPRYLGCGPGDPADLDLGDRLGRAGWLAVAVPSAEVAAAPEAGQGILETRDRGLRRYLHDRHRAPVRALTALVRRG